MTRIGRPARNAGRSVSAASFTARSSASARSWLSETMQIFTRQIIVHKDYAAANGLSLAAMAFNLRPAACMHSRRAPMRAAEIAVRLAMAGVMVLLAVCAGEAAAQAYPPQALASEFDEVNGVDLFGGKRRVDPFDRSLEQRQAWTLFGRLGAINYQNQLDRDSGSGGQFTLKRAGPGIGGTRIYVGIRRRF